MQCSRIMREILGSGINVITYNNKLECTRHIRKLRVEDSMMIQRRLRTPDRHLRGKGTHTINTTKGEASRFSTGFVQLTMAITFAGERFLSPDTGLPDYESERFWIVVKAIIVVFVFVVVLPVTLATPVAEEIVVRTEHNKQKTSKAKKRGKKVVEEIKEGETKKEAPVQAPLLLLNIVCMFTLLALIMTSSNNKLTARSSFVAPLFSVEECQTILDFSHKAAQANAEQNPEDELLALSPVGWRKDRHKSYPTTDLNVVTDPFTKEDRLFLAERLNKRLGPLIERLYGITPAAIRANDMFVVRYDATKGQSHLRRHTDSSHVSFNVLLNDEFEGGGTRFHNRWTEQYKTVKPEVGQVLINNANIVHEGMPTTGGTRYILVGFTSIDRFDPFTNKSTGLSWFASWLSLPWVQVRMKEGTESWRKQRTHPVFNNKYVQSLFRDIHVAFTCLGDWLAPHRIVTVLEAANTTQYLATLDASDDSSLANATWFSGQQINVDVDGTITELWNSRQSNERAFREL